MTFAQKPPESPGLYWFRLVEDSGAHFCRVWRQDGALVTAAGDGIAPVTQFARWWSTEFLKEPDRG